jgi:hypothetical protein
MRFLKFVCHIYVLSLCGTPVNLSFQERVSKHLVKKKSKTCIEDLHSGVLRLVETINSTIIIIIVVLIIVIIIITIIDRNLNLFSLLTF